MAGVAQRTEWIITQVTSRQAINTQHRAQSAPFLPYNHPSQSLTQMVFYTISHTNVSVLRCVNAGKLKLQTQEMEGGNGRI
jgi:hypothetical protein